MGRGELALAKVVAQEERRRLMTQCIDDDGCVSGDTGEYGR
jgi:hypothetical protein